LTRASTPYGGATTKDVDGWHKVGHDEWAVEHSPFIPAQAGIQKDSVTP
jgi:hypothetical protein